MLFKKEKLKFIKHWNAYNGTEIWGEDDKNIEKEFNYWTEEEPFTHNQITRGHNMQHTATATEIIIMAIIIIAYSAFIMKVLPVLL